MLNYSESPLSQLPYLELFQSGGGGGGSQGVFLGGQSRDMFRGGPVKKITLNKEDKLIIRTPSEKLSGLLRRSVSSSGGEVEIRKC